MGEWDTEKTWHEEIVKARKTAERGTRKLRCGCNGLTGPCGHVYLDGELTEESGSGAGGSGNKSASKQGGRAEVMGPGRNFRV